MKISVQFFILLLLMCTSAFAIDAGRVDTVSGDELFMKTEEKAQGVPLKSGSKVQLGQLIQTGKNTEAELELFHEGENTRVKIRKNSLVKIVSKVDGKKKNGVFLFFGRVWSLFKGKSGGYAVETYNSVAGVEGTEFEVAYEAKLDRTILRVMSGKVRFVSRKLKVSGIPNMKNVLADQIAVCLGNRNIKVYKDSKSREYLDLIEMMNSGNMENGSESGKNFVPLNLLSPEDRVDLVCDSEDGASLKLDFLCKDLDDSEKVTKLNCKAYVWIDGCNFNNGSRMEYFDSRSIKIERLEHAVHTVRVLCGGYQHEFEIDLSDTSVKSYQHEVHFIRMKIGLNDAAGTKILGDKGERVFEAFNISLNGQKLVKTVGDPRNNIDPVLTCVGNKSTMLILFLPVSEPRYEFRMVSEKYEGVVLDLDISKSRKWMDVPVKEKSLPEK